MRRAHADPQGGAGRIDKKQMTIEEQSIARISDAMPEGILL
jgi:hypothetical protein